jgi:hypothetical protein
VRLTITPTNKAGWDTTETEQKKSALLEADRSLGMVTRKLFKIFAPTVVVCLALSAASAQESVSVSGGFTGFSGKILGNNTAYINGQTYCPGTDSSEDCSVSVGERTTAFSTPQLSLEFFNKQGSFEDIHNLVQFIPAPAQPALAKVCRSCWVRLRSRTEFGAVTPTSDFH